MIATATLLASTARAEVPSGCRPRAALESHALSPLAADRLRTAPGTTRGPSPGEYLLRDGRVLVQDGVGEPGTLYTADAYRQWQAQLDEEYRLRRVARGDSYHALRGLIDDGDGFAAHVPSLVGELHARLAGDHLDDAQADEAIAKLAARWRDARCRPDPTLFREMTAALGDLVVRRAGSGARWSTRTRAGVVEPIVEYTVDGEKRVATPWEWVDRLLRGDGDLATFVAEALAKPSKPEREDVAAVEKRPDEATPAAAPSSTPAAVAVEPKTPSLAVPRRYR